jgi:hypothetical protein
LLGVEHDMLGSAGGDFRGLFGGEHHVFHSIEKGFWHVSSPYAGSVKKVLT